MEHLYSCGFRSGAFSSGRGLRAQGPAIVCDCAVGSEFAKPGIFRSATHVVHHARARGCACCSYHDGDMRQTCVEKPCNDIAYGERGGEGVASDKTRSLPETRSGTLKEAFKIEYAAVVDV